jgi:nucleotide-binding universal stress UspA family protein
VLIATDGSDDAVAAAAQALSLLAAPEVVTVLCVVEPPASMTAGMESGFSGGIARPEEIDADWAAIDAHAQSAIARTVDGLTTSATVEQRVEVGGAGAEICRVATELAADVVAVGSRGHGAIRRALLGSVSTHVVNNAPCPVVVVRAGTE